ncbi:MAG: hypothetical protein R2834_04005 [Rhodothermales bacterium]
MVDPHVMFNERQSSRKENQFLHGARLFHFVLDALDREKQIKRWGRAKKRTLIRSINPDMVDLSGDLM